MKYLILFSILVIGCGKPTRKVEWKVTQGDKIWYTCISYLGNGNIQFKDHDGKEWIVQGTAYAEKTGKGCR